MLLLFFLGGLPTIARAQERITIQARAKETSAQRSTSRKVHILVEHLSTDNDRQALIDAFKQDGTRGLVHSLHHMMPKGRVQFGGTRRARSTFNFITELPSEDGRRFRLITDHNMALGSRGAADRVSDSSIAIVDIIFTNNRTGSGTVLTACSARLDNDKKQVEAETCRGSWNLTDLVIQTPDYEPAYLSEYRSVVVDHGQVAPGPPLPVWLRPWIHQFAANDKRATRKMVVWAWKVRTRDATYMVARSIQYGKDPTIPLPTGIPIPIAVRRVGTILQIVPDAMLCSQYCDSYLQRRRRVDVTVIGMETAAGKKESARY